MSSEQLGVPLAQVMLTPGTGLFLSPPNAVKLADKRSTAWGLSMWSLKPTSLGSSLYSTSY